MKQINHFKTEIKYDKSDALACTIDALKDHTTRMFPMMKEANTDTVLQCFNDPTCASMRESLGPEENETDPEEDIPTGVETAKQVPKEKMKPAILEHCITLFDNVSAATGYMSAVCANLSSIAKIADEATFRKNLAVSVWPLVQLNILPGILSPLEDRKVNTRRKKEITQLKGTLLPCHDAPALHQESDNSPIWLLLAVLHLKLNQQFFSEGTQVDVQTKYPNCSPVGNTMVEKTRGHLE